MDTVSASTVRDLAKEIAALRRSQRRDRALFLIVGLLLGGGAFAAAAPAPASLDVKSLILRDEAGNARAKLAMGEGGPRLSFADSTGHARLVLGTDSGAAPLLALLDAKGIVRVWTTIEPFGPSLNMKDANGIIRSSLTVVSATEPSNEGPRWELLDAKQASRVVLRASEVESGMRVGAGAGTGTAALRWTADGPRLDLVNVEGKAVFHAP